MTIKALLKRLELAEKRIAALEARPPGIIYHYYHPAPGNSEWPIPSSPSYPTFGTPSWPAQCQTGAMTTLRDYTCVPPQSSESAI